MQSKEQAISRMLYATLLVNTFTLLACTERHSAPPAEHSLTRDSSHVTAEPSDDTLNTDSPAAAVAVIREYYAAITARDFRHAYSLWGDDGTASGKSLHDFVAGFAETARADVETGAPSRVEPAAGSRYIDVPVAIHAVTLSGQEQRFEGTYTLRRTVVDGSTVSERRWHIYSATIRQSHVDK